MLIPHGDFYFASFTQLILAQNRLLFTVTIVESEADCLLSGVG